MPRGGVPAGNASDDGLFDVALATNKACSVVVSVESYTEEYVRLRLDKIIPGSTSAGSRGCVSYADAFISATPVLGVAPDVGTSPTGSN